MKQTCKHLSYNLPWDLPKRKARVPCERRKMEVNFKDFGINIFNLLYCIILLLSFILGASKTEADNVPWALQKWKFSRYLGTFQFGSSQCTLGASNRVILITWIRIRMKMIILAVTQSIFKLRPPDFT